MGKTAIMVSLTFCLVTTVDYYCTFQMMKTGENSLESEFSSSRITRIVTTDFPNYFAIITRIRQEVHAVGPEGGIITSTVVPQVQAIFPEGSLTKKIKVGLQVRIRSGLRKMFSRKKQVRQGFDAVGTTRIISESEPETSSRLKYVDDHTADDETIIPNGHVTHLTQSETNIPLVNGSKHLSDDMTNGHGMTCVDSELNDVKTETEVYKSINGGGNRFSSKFLGAAMPQMDLLSRMA